MESNVLFAELNRDRLGALAADGAVLVIPVGATEQHGPHLPTGTDTLNVAHIALGAASALAQRPTSAIPVVVAPTIPYGSSAHHLPFGATLSLDSEVLLAVLGSLGRSAAASGFTRLFLLNGHGGNQDIIRLAARDISREQHIDVASAAWWELASTAMSQVGADELGRVPGHAGAFETSAVMALRPDLISPVGERRPGTSAAGIPSLPATALRIEHPDMWRRIDGFSDDPARADAGIGARSLEAAVAAVASAIEQFHDSAMPVPVSTDRPEPPTPPDNPRGVTT